MPPSFFKNLHCQKKYIQQLPVNSTRKRKPRSYKYLVQVRYQKFLNLIFSSQCLDFSKYSIGNFLTVCWPRKSRMTTAAHSAAKIFKICGYTEKGSFVMPSTVLTFFVLQKLYLYFHYLFIYLFFYYFYYLLCYRNYTYIFILKLNTGRYCNF